MATNINGVECNMCDIIHKTPTWVYIRGSFPIVDKLSKEFVAQLTNREIAEYICDELEIYNFSYIKTNDKLNLAESFWCTLSDDEVDALSTYILFEYGVDIYCKVKDIKLYRIDFKLYNFKHKLKSKVLEEITISLGR